MASTYSNLKIELIGTGDQSGTWGVTTNTNLGTAIEEAITGSVDVAFSSADVTLTLTNTNTAQTARNLRLNLTGSSGGARNLILGSGCQIEKLYLINNGLADAVTVKNTTGAGVAVAGGKSMFVYNNGTAVVDAITYLSSLTLGSALPVASGGTNASTASITSFNNITGYTASGATGTTSTNLVFSTSPTIASPTLTGTATASGTLEISGGLTLDGAAGTSGQVMVSAGAGNTPTWGNAFVAGMIMLWSGSSATIPSGWLLCDGTNSTPDLRNRFVVGATSTYAVGATGGSADAIVVSHSHTATVTDPGHLHTLPFADGGTIGGSGATSGFRGAGTYNTSTATTGITVANSTTGSSGTNANLPPYYALCYIMKS